MFTAGGLRDQHPWLTGLVEALVLAIAAMVVAALSDQGSTGSMLVVGFIIFTGAFIVLSFINRAQSSGSHTSTPTS
ncbi:MAG: hypothetical protein ACRDI3_05810 [Actinomycetota bacterium]